ncbi:MAG TPA: orotidine 5'-phosphate decarboxylase / HUMPS family protein, partial [Acidimicrobiales bacterium]|nr:orotidine 5'-phosphate decarboxylase / HUMPS family protein [Acidimicrobiales bacterium]
IARAREAGCPGVVTAARNVARVRAQAPGLRVVTPGIRPRGTTVDDHADPATPEAALSAGADVLVIGRAVTAAPDPVAAARRLVESLLEPAPTAPGSAG